MTRLLTELVVRFKYLTSELSGVFPLYLLLVH